MRRHVLLGLQMFQVAILTLHDWVPVGPLNDIAAARRQHSVRALALGTAMSSILPCVGLALSLYYWKVDWPRWLHFYLCLAYGFLFTGELEAWWIPYLLCCQPGKVADYQAMYGRTWAFLRARNGIRINALHFLLHAATLATLLVLASHFLWGE